MLALVLAAGAALAAPVHESVPSRLLGGPVPVVVVTPPSYGTDPARRYPVVTFLHDAQGDEEIVVREGVADALVAAMRSGQLPELILVSPRGKGSWWADAYDGSRPIASFLADELVPWVDARYRTIPERRARAVAGISMGGYGALRLGLTRPELFAVAAGLSPAVQQLSWRSVQALPFFLRPTLRDVFGRDEIGNQFLKNDLYEILLDRPELRGSAPTLLLRAGTEDKYRLSEVIGFFDRYLGVMGIERHVVLEPGVHDWPYWRRSLPALVADAARRLAVR